MKKCYGCQTCSASIPAEFQQNKMQLLSVLFYQICLKKQADPEQRQCVLLWIRFGRRSLCTKGRKTCGHFCDHMTCDWREEDMIKKGITLMRSAFQLCFKGAAPARCHRKKWCLPSQQLYFNDAVRAIINCQNYQQSWCKLCIFTLELREKPQKIK